MKVPSLLRFLAGCVALLSLVTVAYAGGGDLVTVKDFPDFAVAGKTLELTFTVWVPSLEPLTDLHPVVRATPYGQESHAYKIRKTSSRGCQVRS